jgi:endonuclease/exonuclease/phosphatase family metal-dependent hydrolase
MRRRSAWLALSMLALSIVALSCGGAEQPRVRLVVVSHNILHGLVDEDPEAEPYDRLPERIHLIADAVAELKPDIVFLQEVVPGRGDDYGDVRQIMLDALGAQYQAVFGDITGAAINTGGIGQMTLTRLPIASSENHFIGGARSVHRLTVDTDDGPLDLYNTHLEGTGAVIEATQDDSVVEIRNLLDFIRDTRTDEAPAILAGDLNAEPQDPSIRELLGEGFIDVLAAGGDATCEAVGDPGCTSGTTPLAEPGNRTDHRIDYIFTLDGTEASLSIREAQLFLNEPVDIGGGRVLWASDHIGNQAVLELR